jgi:hypothetical protein
MCSDRDTEMCVGGERDGHAEDRLFRAVVCDLFTKGSHHRSISVILITQNLFHQGRYCRDISLNATYLVLLKNVRDKHQFAYLARQVFPEYSDSLYKAYLGLHNDRTVI